MRLAAPADIPALEAIALETLRRAYPDEKIEQQTIPGFAEQFARDRVLVHCKEDVTAFILCERMEDESWCVRYLMPPPPVMTIAMSVELIRTAFLAEHLQRPFASTTKCWAQLEEQSAVERLTRDAMQQTFKTVRTDIIRAGVIKASVIFISASNLAKKLRVTL